MILLTFLLACTGDTTTDSTADEDPAEHACEQVGVPGTAVTATAEPEGAPAVEPSEDPLTVTLVDDGTGVFSGYISLHADVALDALLFTDTPDIVATLWDGETEVGLAEPGPNEFCPDELPEHWPLALAEGTYTLELGPSATDTLWLMYLSAAGHVAH